MEYGIIYLKIIPKSKDANFIEYCHIFDSLSEFLQIDLMSVIARLNEDHVNDMVVPIHRDVHPGCITLPESVEKVAKDMYERYDALMMELLDEHCIRCVYTVGEVVNPRRTLSIHRSWGKGLIKAGRYLDSSYNIGLFEVV